MFSESVRRMLGGALAVWLAATILAPVSAFAYAGPGAGISALGTLFAIVSAFFLAIVGFVWYPVKRLIRWIRGGKSGDKETGA